MDPNNWITSATNNDTKCFYVQKNVNFNSVRGTLFYKRVI